MANVTPSTEFAPIRCWGCGFWDTGGAAPKSAEDLGFVSPKCSPLFSLIVIEACRTRAVHSGSSRLSHAPSFRGDGRPVAVGEMSPRDRGGKAPTGAVRN